jgi:uncharacterized protein (DUF924 family)
MDPAATEILVFWFGDGTRERDEWFRKDPAFDEAIRDRFGAVIDAALGGAFAGWADGPRGALALVVLLDQLPRNALRGTPRMYAGDARARSVATGAIAAGFDAGLRPHERMFLYLPFVHAEDPDAQERSIALAKRLAQETGFASPLEWAEKHAAVIRRFGRFPHRNAILGRPSTAAEIAFLAEPGSRF